MKTELEIQNFLLGDLDKLNSLCRICLSENTDRGTSLFEMINSTSLFEKVILCARVQITNDDGFPTIICAACRGELDIADEFRTKCEYSDALLRKLCLSNPVKASPSTSEDIKREDDEDWIKMEDESGGFEDGDDSPDSASKAAVSKKIEIEEEKNKPPEKNIKKPSSETSTKKNSRVKTCKIKSTKIKVSKEENALKKFSCHVCGKSLSTKYSLQMHMACMHRDDENAKYVKMFKCSECPYSTPRSLALGYHMSIHTGAKPYKCDVCERCFAQPGSLHVHKKSHSDKMYYTCAECGKQFKHKMVYENHKNVHNSIKKFTCAICNKGLKSQQTLDDHMNRHNNIKNYSCEVCGSTFVTRVELISHRKKHSNEKRFRCNICTYRCNVKRSLETHMLRHTGQRLFKCELCELSCYTRVELKLHMRRHTKEKNYSCPVCQTKFARSTGVNKHMLLTHGIQFKMNDTRDRRIIK